LRASTSSVTCHVPSVVARDDAFFSYVLAILRMSSCMLRRLGSGENDADCRVPLCLLRAGCDLEGWLVIVKYFVRTSRPKASS
jgi:hypothetical protein